MRSNDRSLRIHLGKRGWQSCTEGVRDRRCVTGGGASVNSLEVMKRPEFICRFKRKGCFADLLERIPVHVVASPAGLAGSA